MRGRRLPSASTCRTASPGSPKVSPIAAGLRPSLTSRVKVSHWVTSSASRRATFSISDASTASASSLSSRMAQGSASGVSPASARSAATMLAAWKRRLPATISKCSPSASDWPLAGRTMTGWSTPRRRTVGRISDTSGGRFVQRMLALLTASRSSGMNASFIGFLLRSRPARGPWSAPGGGIAAERAARQPPPPSEARGGGGSWPNSSSWLRAFVSNRP